MLIFLYCEDRIGIAYRTLHTDRYFRYAAIVKSASTFCVQRSPVCTRGQGPKNNPKRQCLEKYELITLETN